MNILVHIKAALVFILKWQIHCPSFVSEHVWLWKVFEKGQSSLKKWNSFSNNSLNDNSLKCNSKIWSFSPHNIFLTSIFQEDFWIQILWLSRTLGPPGFGGDPPPYSWGEPGRHKEENSSIHRKNLSFLSILVLLHGEQGGIFWEFQWNSTNRSLTLDAEHLLCFCFCILIGFVGNIVQAPDQVLEGAVKTKGQFERKIIETPKLENTLKIIQSHRVHHWTRRDSTWESRNPVWHFGSYWAWISILVTHQTQASGMLEIQKPMPRRSKIIYPAHWKGCWRFSPSSRSFRLNVTDGGTSTFTSLSSNQEPCKSLCFQSEIFTSGSQLSHL